MSEYSDGLRMRIANLQDCQLKIASFIIIFRNPHEDSENGNVFMFEFDSMTLQFLIEEIYEFPVKIIKNALEITMLIWKRYDKLLRLRINLALTTNVDKVAVKLLGKVLVNAYFDCLL